MLSVPMDEADLRPHLTGDLDMASVNAPGLCVVSGPDAALQSLAATLAGQGIETQRIAIDIAAHSRMLEPILARFGDYLRSIPLQAPQHPDPLEPQRPAADGGAGDRPGLLGAAPAQYGELPRLHGNADGHPGPGLHGDGAGPGAVVAGAGQWRGLGQVIPALRHPEQKMADDAWHLASIARLWACGVAVDWAPIWGGQAAQPRAAADLCLPEEALFHRARPAPGRAAG
jgi:acyl transferase domain-containing protein